MGISYEGTAFEGLREKLEATNKRMRMNEFAYDLYELVANPCPHTERGDSGWCDCEICQKRKRVLAYIEGN